MGIPSGWKLRSGRLELGKARCFGRLSPRPALPGSNHISTLYQEPLCGVSGMLPSGGTRKDSGGPLITKVFVAPGVGEWGQLALGGLPPAFWPLPTRCGIRMGPGGIWCVCGVMFIVCPRGEVTSDGLIWGHFPTSSLH